MSHASRLPIAYRPEIDGLRTISILLVIFDHLKWSLFSGGYVGVDVFFVISGFLISQVLIKSVEQNRFSIAEFYKRRIIRIAPAYFTLLVVVTVAALFCLLPDELLTYLKSVQYSLVFLSNIYDWKEVGGYFSAKAEYIPLLHLWSLAVEEQFYIIWPVVIWLLWKYFKSKTIIILVLVALLISLAISEYGVRYSSSIAYFMMPPRAFELLLGAIIAIIPKYSFPKVPDSIWGLCGLSMIVAAALLYTDQTLFPGVHALLPCLGAALILYFTRTNTGPDGHFLGSRVMVYLGKLSYPAYLWHWPIIAFLNIQQIDLSFMVCVAALALTFVLSALTYHFVELPAKRGHTYSVRTVVIVGYIFPTLVFIAIIFALKSLKGLPSRFPESLNMMSSAINSKPQKLRHSCHGDGHSAATPDSADHCILGDANRPVDFLLIGDSHANHFTGMIDVMAKDAGLRGYDITQNATIYLPETESFYTEKGIRKNFPAFKVRNDVLTSIINKGHYKAVIMGGSFAKRYQYADYESPNKSDSKQIFIDQLQQAITIIKSTGAKVILIKGNSVLENTNIDYMCSLNSARFHQNNECKTPRSVHDANFADWNRIVNQLKAKTPDLVVIEPDKIMCDDKYCYSSLSDIPLFVNKDHLNNQASELIGKLYIQKFGNPLQIINH